MILKKPFAFLIKYFKVIHIFLLILTAFITFRFNKIVQFFTKYVGNTNIVNDRLASSYVPPTIFLAIVIVIIFSGLMWFLMFRKEKPSRFYLFTGIYYFILFIAIIHAYSVIGNLASASMTGQSARAYRDIYQILLFPNFYFIFWSFVRGIGFDIKKFNFNKDLEELEIKSEDNEEFEFVLGNDSYKYKRKARRYLREFTYYIKENKIFISIILGSLIIIGLILIFLNVTFFNHIYTIGETLKTNNFTYKLNKAYITSYDYTGKEIKKDKKYLILDFTLNSNNNTQAIKSEEFYLKQNNTVINYKTSLSDSFSDLGISYKNSKIGTDKTNNIFIFEIDANYKSKKYTLKIFDKINYKNNNSEYVYQTYRINPINIDNIHKEEEKKLNESITLNKELYGNTNLIIKSIKIGNSYQYNYQECDSNSICTNKTSIEFPINNTKYTLMTLEYELNIDQNSSIYNVVRDNPKIFFEKFLKVSYTNNKKTFYNVTSSRINSNINNTIFVDIPKQIQNFDNKNLVISTRCDNYSIKIE